MLINFINSLHNVVLLKLIIPYLYAKKSNHTFKHKLLRKIKDLPYILESNPHQFLPIS